MMIKDLKLGDKLIYKRTGKIYKVIQIRKDLRGVVVNGGRFINYIKDTEIDYYELLK